jgi:hypothetical protein
MVFCEGTYFLLCSLSNLKSPAILPKYLFLHATPLQLPHPRSLPSATDTPSYMKVEEKTAYKQNVRKYDIVEGEKILV